MNNTFKEKISKKATLCFLIKDSKVLLAMKKRGFGVGKWNGVGGKVKIGESIKEAILREAKEEINVDIQKIKKVALLNFYFQEKPDWNQRVWVYLSDSWHGEPEDSEEMRPKWFDINKIPYRKMWWDDKLWLPEILKGNKIVASFLFDANEQVIEQKIILIKIN